MTPDTRFRHELAQALPLWVSEALISAEQAEHLRHYYRLDTLEAGGRSRFVTVLLFFGATLVGLGVLSFVAANWELISREARALGGLGLLVGLDVLGDRWWRQPARRRWGGALLALAGFLLGGNIALMAQWFQVSGAPWGLFAAWGAGCLAMGWAQRHGFLVAMASALLFTAMCLSAPAEWAFPWLFGLVIMPLARACRSKAAWLLGALGLMASTVFMLAPYGALAATLGLLSLGLGLWSAGELAIAFKPLSALARPLHWERPEDAAPIEAAVGRPLALLTLLGVFSFWSFKGAWNLLNQVDFAEMATPAFGASGFGVAALALAGYALAWRRSEEPLLHRCFGAASALLLALLAFASPVVGSLAANAMMLAVSLVLAWQGLKRANRLWFWLGFGCLGHQVFVRFMEFETGLLIKSLAFVLWGLALIAVGIRSERALSRQAAAQ